MKLHILGSSSQGNCYLFQGITETLIWDCGISLLEVKKALNFDISGIVGCIVDHIHGDHFSKVKDFLSAGINVYASQGTIDKSGIKNHHLLAISHKRLFNLGGFEIYPFDVKHDAPEPLGFLIRHKECGTTLAVTDTYYIPYKFPGLTNILCEANYDLEIANQAIENGASVHVRNRVMQSHMSIDTLCDFLKANDLSKVNNIVLLHLSNGNSNAKEFKRRVQEVAPGKRVTIADKNIEIDFSIYPF